MDAKKTIRKYITRGAWISIMGLAALAVGLVSLLVAVVSGGESAGGVIGAILGIALSLLMLPVGLPSQLQAKKCIQTLESKGLLEKAAEELGGSGTQTLGKNKAILTEHFLFGRKTGVVLAYGDIVWCYKKRVRVNLIQIIDSLTVYTPTMKEVMAINLGGADRYGLLNQAVERIHAGNPGLLVGFTKENRKAYKEIARQKV